MIGRIDSGGNQVVSYNYNSWGKPLAITDTSEEGIGSLNSFRYRGYCYDEETGYYYLKSRYYDPVVGRFINADGYVSTGQGLTGHNMYAYCGNNPINRVDSSGLFWKKISNFFSDVWNRTKSWLKNTFGSSVSFNTTRGAVSSTPIREYGNSSRPITTYVSYDREIAREGTTSATVGVSLNSSKRALDISYGDWTLGVTYSVSGEVYTNSTTLSYSWKTLSIGIGTSSAIQWDDSTHTTYTNLSVNIMRS